VSATRIPTVLALAAALGCAGAPARPPEPAAKAAKARPASSPTERAAQASAGAAPAAPAADAIPARAQRLFAEAVQAEEDQRKLKVPTDWALLERRWRAVLDAADVPEARFNLGVAVEAQGRLDEARAEYQRARAAKPTLRQAAVNLGVLLEKAGDASGAQAAYAQVLRDFPEDARARERLAALYRAAGQLDEAWRLAREALLRDPRSVGAYKVMAQVALQRGQLDLANLVALRAQKLAPADPELPFYAGQVLARQGDDAAAAVQFRKALALREDFVPARHALLAAAVKQGSWGQVAEHAGAVLKRDPRNAPVQLALGVALRHLEKPDEALAAYARAEALSGDTLAEVHLARGVLYMRVKSECEPALDEFRAYARVAGPVATAESPVLKLQRECEQVVAENRKAAEAARALKLEAERKAAEDAARKRAAEKPAAGVGPEQGGAAVPTSAPAPGR
jgi:tetratricopeptide (TPR) repeat protein